VRVTVVATGLGPDYGNLERPTVIRKSQGNAAVDLNGHLNMDYLDIPAFLRKQAD
jgi:cell division protein FtsZ